MRHRKYCQHLGIIGPGLHSIPQRSMCPMTDTHMPLDEHGIQRLCPGSDRQPLGLQKASQRAYELGQSLLANGAETYHS